MKDSDVSIIIPAHNEVESIGAVISNIRSLHPDFEIIVVDDGSTDGTGDEAKNQGALVYRHPYNIGNGAAIKSGIRIASGKVLVFMDGDGQHDPADIDRFLAALSRIRYGRWRQRQKQTGIMGSGVRQHRIQSPGILCHQVPC